MYCRFESGVHPREPLGDMLLAICDHSSSVEDHIRLLLKRLTYLKQKLEEHGIRKRDSVSETSPNPINQIEKKIENCLMDNKFLYEKESKYHCWRCGEVFCTRCIDKHTALPGHFSQRAVPVCRPCYREVTRSNSVESP
ncbi:hypothetical protein B566_EDAN003104 [Ephemera danica]|nr:hypothetical protein B566_EDAN003104 [Ephemera danica]